MAYGTRKLDKKDSERSLLYASAAGDIVAVKRLLDQGKNINRRGPQNTTPLHIAAFYDKEECAKVLIARGADIEAVDNDMCTPLQGAALNGSLNTLKVLLKNNANIESRDYDGATPLHKATFAGKRACMRYLVQKGAVVDVTDDSGNTPLHYAADNGHVECINFLLRQGANPNAKAEDQTTPIHRAAIAGHEDCVTLLLKHGAHAGEPDMFGATPLHYAVEAGSVDSVRAFLAHKVNVNALDTLGTSPLHVAAFKGHTRLLRMLHEQGAKHDVEGASSSPLHHAAAEGHTDTCTLLLELGANVNALDREGRSPLMHAAMNGHRDATRILLSRGAVTTCVDAEGSTPLHLAVLSGSAACVTELLTSGVDREAVDSRGETALHKASRRGDLECVEALLTKAANVNAVSPTGTALHIALFEGHVAVAERLVRGMADLHAKSPADGAEPLHYAAASPNTDVLQLFLEVLYHEVTHPSHPPLRTRSSSAYATNFVPPNLTSPPRYGTPPSSGGHRNASTAPRSIPASRLTPSFSVNDLSSLIPTSTLIHSSSASSVPTAKKAYRLSLSAPILTPFTVLTTSPPPSPTTSTPSPPTTPTSTTPTSPITFSLASTPPNGAVPTLTRSNSILNRPRTIFSLPDRVFQVTDTEGRTPLQWAIQHRREDSTQLLLLCGNDVSPFLLDSDEVPFSWRDMIRQIIEKRDKVEESSEKDFAIAVQDFNKRPKKGIEYLISKKLIENTPKDIGHFLYTTVGLSKRKLGDFLGDGDEFIVSILESYVSEFDFTDMSLDKAIRHFLSKFWLPGEAQKIDRFMDFFSRQFCKNNPSVFSSSDTAYVVSFSLIMLNTDAHNPAIKKELKMTLDQFLRNTATIPGISQVPRSYLESLYMSIVHDEIHIDYEGSSFCNVEKKGWLTKQGGRIKTWKQRWFMLSGNVLYYFKSPTDTEPLGLIPLENVAVRPAEVRGRKFTFGLYAKNSGNNETLKAAKYQGSGLVPAHHEHYLLSAEAKEFMDSWIAAISNSIFQSPFQELVNRRKAVLNTNNNNVSR